MTTCETCRHWRPETVTEWDGEVSIDLPGTVNVRTYDLAPRDPLTHETVRPSFPIGHCVQPLLVELSRPATRTALTVLDGSGYAAALVTGPEFGCVNHEPKARP